MEENDKNFIVKYTPKVHNFMVVPKYKTQFLHINLKLIHLLQTFQFVVFSLISILVGIPWSSESGARNFIKKETLAQVFSCEFWENSKNTFFTKHLRTTASHK